ncbi:hypothetical protein [Wenzhouxiangella sp. XN24]|uniref:hypothetical protein n=1 Tax=Wenzhouxiangella sp. XN24 TaxID=2713569 RepID=UPI0013EC4D37|nr:hypothetical protein [Wenzhouxiangella sp. XN24]NGX14793.1 hypothetical protein [Wenzhouxiangella sp. XN24]
MYSQHVNRWLAATLVMAVMAAQTACGPSASADLSGVWRFDREATLAGLQKSRGGPEADMQSRMAQAMVEQIDWRLVLHHGGDAVLVFAEGSGASGATGTWSQEGDALRIDYLGKRDRAAQSLTARIDKRGLVLEPREPGEPALHFVKDEETSLAATPPLGSLRSECDGVTAKADKSAVPGDIVGVSPGMSFDEAVAILECRSDVRVVDTAPLWTSRENFGLATRGMLRGTDGVPCQDFEAPACEQGAYGLGPMRKLRTEYVAGLTGMPGEEVVRAVWRRSRFSEADGQSIQALTTALSQKYGVPQIQAEGNHLRLNNLRAGSTNLVWVFDVKGHAMPVPASQFNNAAMQFEQCINGPKPAFTAAQSWNSGCGLTIRAEIVPLPGNSLVAGEFNMVVMHQRDLYHGNQQFQHALRLAGEQRVPQPKAATDL